MFKDGLKFERKAFLRRENVWGLLRNRFYKREGAGASVLSDWSHFFFNSIFFNCWTLDNHCQSDIYGETHECLHGLTGLRPPGHKEDSWKRLVRWDLVEWVEKDMYVIIWFPLFESGWIWLCLGKRLDFIIFRHGCVWVNVLYWVWVIFRLGYMHWGKVLVYSCFYVQDCRLFHRGMLLLDDKILSV